MTPYNLGSLRIELCTHKLVEIDMSHVFVAEMVQKLPYLWYFGTSDGSHLGFEGQNGAQISPKHRIWFSDSQIIQSQL